jgi:hypothetical protein
MLWLVPFLLQAANPASTYVTAGSIYTENTIAVIIEILVILAISMQIARGYFLRILRKFTLRLAADLWWLLFILLRDASIFVIVFLGVSLFWPGTYQDYPIAVPFQLLAIDLYAFALVLLLIKDTDEDPKYNSWLTILVVLGGFLYVIGTVFVTESATALATLPPTVSLNPSNIWGFFNTYFNSINNTTLAIYSFYVTFALLLIAGGIAISVGFRSGNNISKRNVITTPNPVAKTVSQQPQQKPDTGTK